MSDLSGANSDNRQLVARWYAVYTQPHRERLAVSHLRRQGLRTFLPTLRQTVRHARQFRIVLAPLFPRYVFVELTLGKDRWRSVNGTVGVTKLVSVGDHPTPVPCGVLEELATSSDDAGVLGTDPRLRPGEVVRITAGPFSGLVGTLAALDGAGRARVLLEILGGERLVAVRSSRVGLVSAA